MIHIFDHALQFRLRPVFSRAERRFAVAIALPIAPAAAPPTPPPPPPLAGLAFADWRAFVAWLRRLGKSLFLGRGSVVVAMRYGMFGKGLVRERLCVFARFAGAAAASAPAPPPPAAATFALAFGPRFDLRFCRHEFRFLRVLIGFGFLFEILSGRNQLRLLSR